MKVATLTFKTAPGPVLFKLVGIIISASLPLATTYLAALTASELAAAYGGDADAGSRALLYIALTAVIGLFTISWNSIDQYLQATLRYKVDARIADSMYNHFLSLEFWRYDDKDTIDVYERAKRFAQFFAYVFDKIGTTFTQLVIGIFSIVGLLLVAPWLALLIVVALIPGIWLQLRLSRLQINHWNKNVDVRRARQEIEWDLLQPQNIAELRINNLVKHLMQLRNTLREKDERARLGFEKKFLGGRILSDALETIAELGALLWIALQIIAQQQPVGQFIFIQQVVNRAINSINSFANQLTTMDEDLANLFDYQRFMDLPNATKQSLTLPEAEHTIEVQDISFSYLATKQAVLKNISFTIAPGKHIAIVGENGAGKSTLVKLLLGLYVPSSGTITVSGYDLRNIDSASWHKHIAVLQQDFQEYHFASARDNVYFGDVSKKFNAASYTTAINDAQAAKFINKLPQKDKTLLSTWYEGEDEEEKGVRLSGGQWQRLALARSFYRNAPIIILDEPTSAIDALAESKIFRKLFAASSKKTVITISHRLSTVEKADEIIVLKDGQIAERGTHAELIAKNGEYVRIFESQLPETVKTDV